MRRLPPKKTILIPLLKTSNIADGGYLGTAATLAFLGPSLKPRDINPHATLIALYMNAVEEWVVQYQGENLDTSAELRRVEPYIFGEDADLSLCESSEFNKYTVLMEASITRGRDGDLHFDRYVAFLGTWNARTWGFESPSFPASLPPFLIPPSLISSLAPCSLKACIQITNITDNIRYMQDLGFAKMSWSVGLMVKEENTIIEKWPMRLKLSLPQPGAQEEFDILQGSGHSGNERYVEWKRV